METPMEALQRERQRLEHEHKLSRVEVKVARLQSSRASDEREWRLVKHMGALGFMPRTRDHTSWSPPYRRFVRPLSGSSVPEELKEFLDRELPRVVPDYQTHRVRKNEIVVFLK